MQEEMWTWFFHFLRFKLQPIKLSILHRLMMVNVNIGCVNCNRPPRGGWIPAGSRRCRIPSTSWFLPDGKDIRKPSFRRVSHPSHPPNSEFHLIPKKKKIFKNKLKKKKKKNNNKTRMKPSELNSSVNSIKAEWFKEQLNDESWWEPHCCTTYGNC